MKAGKQKNFTPFTMRPPPPRFFQNDGRTVSRFGQNVLVLVVVLKIMIAMKHWWNDSNKENGNYSDAKCLSATFSTINPLPANVENMVSPE
jgi:hypothetical protein